MPRPARSLDISRASTRCTYARRSFAPCRDAQMSISQMSRVKNFNFKSSYNPKNLRRGVLHSRNLIDYEDNGTNSNEVQCAPCLSLSLLFSFCFIFFLCTVFPFTFFPSQNLATYLAYFLININPLAVHDRETAGVLLFKAEKRAHVPYVHAGQSRAATTIAAVSRSDNNNNNNCSAVAAVRIQIFFNMPRAQSRISNAAFVNKAPYNWKLPKVYVKSSA
uniref:Uncharacterized protein n=1 Tax=Trichogramma kaykai TaxID=54128 RepID=A0ABD2VVG2_9HYME